MRSRPLPAGLDAIGLDAALKLTAVIWLPLSVGVILPDIARQFGPQLREIEESKRKAELAPYTRKPS